MTGNYFIISMSAIKRVTAKDILWISWKWENYEEMVFDAIIIKNK